MTMADQIAVMNAGRIEQLGSPDELYERPRTAFVASFLGASNLLRGRAAGEDVVRLEDGTEVRVPAAALAGRTGPVAVGIRPEKIRLAAGESNMLEGVIAERSYIGVSTQYIAQTGTGSITVYAQNTDHGPSGLAAGDRVTLSWSPESTFVVDALEEERR